MNGNFSAVSVTKNVGNASVLCPLHCLALPFLLSLLPSVAHVFVGSEVFHHGVLILVAPTAFAVFWLGYRHHPIVMPALLGVTGLVCLIAGVLPGLAEGIRNRDDGRSLPASRGRSYNELATANAPRPTPKPFRPASIPR